MVYVKLGDDENVSLCQMDSSMVTSTNMIDSNIVWTALRLTKLVGSKILQGCDYVGEKFANWFGITKPKYEAEIREYQWMMEREKKKKEKLQEEFAGWQSSDTPDSLGLVNKPI